jgi:hypothetical protein
VVEDGQVVAVAHHAVGQRIGGGGAQVGPLTDGEPTDVQCLIHVIDADRSHVKQ